ncbi:NAD-dependent histone deacetylase HST4 [Lachancea thermotolerans CBS 6340]|uniref:KLTH0F08514p n=1 Tax=Lachancea thermotolerans (strain ATCC 56472 / CBS 6340 / NRRL Y-8284) TaxID=559295 RepID=C5DKY5_LACTC|nr:KLTH0F08514p [Lachancea thermotolerans CBS 6340]CAR24136.1 KLTH0F08514p [Lachancea thermotolerans CBS 6340]
MHEGMKQGSFPEKGQRANTMLPLTPPSTVQKPSASDNREEILVTPRKLFPELKKLSSKARKPPLRYRPEKNTVFDIEQYIEGCRRGKCNEKDAKFLRYAFEHSRRVVMVAGAGVSVAAGIPDFRSSGGLFSTLRDEGVASGKELFDFNSVYSSVEVGQKFNRMITNMHARCQETRPTEFHRLANTVAKEGRLTRLYTQNIDGIEDGTSHLQTQVPLEKPFPNTIQLHGSIKHMFCNKCSKIYDMNPSLFKAQEEQTGREVFPLCPQCTEFEAVREVAGMRSQGVGKLRPRIVLYNEVHPEGESIGDVVSKDLKGRPDCLIIVGTTLKIPGVRAMCKQFARQVHQSKGIVLWLNTELPTKSIEDFLGFIDLIVVGDCQKVTSLFDASGALSK